MTPSLPHDVDSSLSTSGEQAQKPLPMLSRKTRGPSRTCGLTPLSGCRLLLGAVGEHGEDAPAAEPASVKRQMAPVGRPGGVLVVSRAGRELAHVGAVRAHGPQVVGAPARGDR